MQRTTKGIEEFNKNYLESASQFDSCLLLPKDPVPRRSGRAHLHYFIGGYVDLLPFDILPNAYRFLRSLKGEVQYTLVQRTKNESSAFLIYPEDISQAIKEVAEKTPLLDAILAIAREPGNQHLFQFAFAKPETLLAETVKLFHLNLTPVVSEIVKHYQAVGSLTGLDKKLQTYVRFFGEDAFKNVTELHVFRTTLLNFLSKEHEKWVNGYVSSLGPEVFFRLVVPHAIAIQARARLELLSQQAVSTPKDQLDKKADVPTQVQVESGASVLATVPTPRAGSMGKTAAPKPLMRVLEDKRIVAGSYPKSEKDIERLLDLIIANKINQVIFMEEGKQIPGSHAVWFKVCEAIKERNKKLGGADRRQKTADLTIQYGSYAVTDKTFDKTSSFDLSDKESYTLEVHKRGKPQIHLIKVHYFKYNEKFERLTAQDWDRVYNIHDMQEDQSGSPILVQAESPSASASIQTAFQGIDTGKARLSQTRSRDSASQDNGPPPRSRDSASQDNGPPYQAMMSPAARPVMKTTDSSPDKKVSSPQLNVDDNDFTAIELPSPTSPPVSTMGLHSKSKKKRVSEAVTPTTSDAAKPTDRIVRAFNGISKALLG